MTKKNIDVRVKKAIDEATVEDDDSTRNFDARISKAIEEGRIEMAESDEIEQYSDMLSEFLKTLFNLDEEDVIVTDLSTLGDFSPCCLTDDASIDSWEEMQKVADETLMSMIEAAFGIKTKPSDRIIDVLRQIKESKTHAVH